MKIIISSTLLLLSLLLPVSAYAYDFEVNGIYYNINDNEATVTYQYSDYYDPAGEYYGIYSEYHGHMTIPSSVTYQGTTYSVTTIGAFAFQHCSGLISITIPNSVIVICDEAFSGCTNLRNITIPNSITEIGCNVLEATAWYDNQPDGVIYIGLFVYGYKGTMPEGGSITLREGTVGIAGGAFECCSWLTNIVIPNTVTIIGDRAFCCSGLTSINIPNSVTTLGWVSLADCNGLTSVIIPNSVTTLRGAFANCFGLESATIPNSVTRIFDHEFYNCIKLKDVYCYISDPSSVSLPTSTSDEGPIFYLENYDERTLHVPAGSLDFYQADTRWSKYFSSVVEMEPDNPILASSIELNATTVNMTERKTLQLMAMVLPEDATQKKVTWISSNETVATVDNSGLVTAIGPGSTTITATTTDGSELSASCRVTIKSQTSNMNGDVNGDGKVNITDVTDLINVLLSGEN